MSDDTSEDKKAPKKKAAAKAAAKKKAAAQGGDDGGDRNLGTRKKDLDRAEAKKAFQEERAKEPTPKAETAMRGGDKHIVDAAGNPEAKAATKAKKKKKKIVAEYTPPSPEVLQRRTFLRAFGWTGLTTYITFLTGLAVRFFWPRILFEPPTAFTAGYPSEFAVGEVNTNFQNSFRVWIVREVTGMYALIAKCTHLGCTPVWLDAKNKFKCPCHGSGFTKAGVNFEGPAPRPLERATIRIRPDGKLFVDKSKVHRQERGEWEKNAGKGASVIV